MITKAIEELKTTIKNGYRLTNCNLIVKTIDNEEYTLWFDYPERYGMPDVWGRFERMCISSKCRTNDISQRFNYLFPYSTGHWEMVPIERVEQIFKDNVLDYDVVYWG